MPSKSFTFDFEGNFGPSSFFSVSTTIEIDRSIFDISSEKSLVGLAKKKDRQPEQSRLASLAPDVRLRRTRPIKLHPQIDRAER